MKNRIKNWSRTKIVATIGPASDKEDVLKKMIQTGMDVVRLNFSHGTIESHSESVKRIKKISQDAGKNVAILQDLPGPKIRLGKMRENVVVKRGDLYTFVKRNVVGDEKRASINYTSLFKSDLKEARLLIDDGRVEMRVVKQGKESLECKVVYGGVLKDHKGINIPAVRLKIPSVTKSDYQYLDAGMKMGVDLVALSFVRYPDDIRKVRRYLKRHGYSAFLISKIEKMEAVDNIDRIIDVSDGIMVARGDLGVEIPLIEVPNIQKMIIAKCNRAGKPVITATQVLESMIGNPSPTRAEAADAANAVYDGTDALMLSGESSVGKYPAGAVKFLNAISRTVEESITPDMVAAKRADDIGDEIATNIGLSAVKIAQNTQSKLILTPTRTGRTARLVSRFRPAVPVIALTDDPQVERELHLSFGVIPLMVDRDYVFNVFLIEMKKMVLDLKLANKGDKIVICSGSPGSEKGETNLLTVEQL
ncbi:MAG: pyruvate kinase [candidate division Zixibacteria bacterium]|nr:pyruvate kinase [candidate division Zixibacteria bacterium]